MTDFTPQDRPMSGNAPLSDKIDQLWRKVQIVEADVKKITGAVDTSYSTARLLSLIRAVKGHSSSMPDHTGANADHDQRYVRTGSFASLFRTHMAINVKIWDHTVALLYDSFNSYIEAQGTSEVSIIFAVDAELEDDLDMGNIDIVGFWNGAMIYGAYSLIINKMSARPRHQIFDSTVTAVLAKDIERYPEWDGAVGDGSIDDTDAIRRCIARGGRIVFDGKTFVTGELHPISDSIIELRAGAVLHQRSADVTDASYNNIIHLANVENIEINGHTSGIIRGRLAGNSDGRMAIRLDSSSIALCQNIHVHDITLENMDGDGMYFGNNENHVDAVIKNCLVENVISQNHRRQGYSIISAVNLTFRNCIAQNIGQTYTTDPSAGWDIEPDIGQIKNVLLEDCHAYNNVGAGFMADVSNYFTYTDLSTENKEVFFEFRNCRAESNGKHGFRITECYNNAGIFKIINCSATDNEQNALYLRNLSAKNRYIIDGFSAKNNCSESTDSDWDFPAYNTDDPAPHVNANAKADIIIVTSETLYQETLNGGTGLIAGNVELRNIQVVQDSTDRICLHMGSYEGASGALRPPMVNVVVDGLYIRTPANKLWIFDEYAYDVQFKNVYVWDTTNYRWEEAKNIYTVDTSLGVTVDQGVWISNRGDTALVTYTLPAGEASDSKKARYKFKCEESSGIKLACTGTRGFFLFNGKFVSNLYSYYVGSQLKCEKFQYTVQQFGASDSQFDISNPSGSTFRYTYDGTGTAPLFVTNGMKTGDIILIASSNFNAANTGSFKIIAVAETYFEVINSTGVVESNVTRGTGSLQLNRGTWLVTEHSGVWLTSCIELLPDSDYYLTVHDNGKFFSNENHTVPRVLYLPEITAVIIGLEFEFFNRNSSTNLTIDPSGTDCIFGITSGSPAGHKIQAGGQGSSIKLMAVSAGGGSWWKPVYLQGPWYDIDGVGNENYVRGDQRFAGVIKSSDTTDASADDTGAIQATDGGIYAEKTVRTNGDVVLATDTKGVYVGSNKVVGARGAALTAQLTAITHTVPGTPDYAIQNLTNSSGYGFATADEGNTVLSVIANLQTRVTELEARLKATGGHGLIADP